MAMDLWRSDNKTKWSEVGKPPSGGSFGRGRRWLGRHSPLRGCSDLAAWPTTKISHRSPPRNFQTSY